MATLKMRLFPKAHYQRKNVFEFTHKGTMIVGDYTIKNMERLGVSILKSVGSKKLTIRLVANPEWVIAKLINLNQ